MLFSMKRFVLSPAAIDSLSLSDAMRCERGGHVILIKSSVRPNGVICETIKSKWSGVLIMRF